MAGSLLPSLPPTSLNSSPPLQPTLASRNLFSNRRATFRASMFLRSFQSAHDKLSIAHFFISANIVQKEKDDPAKSSSAFSPKREMGLLANGFLLSCLLLGNLNDVAIARAAVFGPELSSEQQQVEPSKGNCATCLGVVDETLGACGAAPNCVSTFDDRPSFFIAPWEFPGKLTTAFQQIEGVLKKEGGNIVEQGNRYLRAVFTDKDGNIDDLEFLFSIPSEDATVNIRSASRKFSQNDYGRNQKRLERIRCQF
eukprot:c20522_g1_i2 orf=368-1129(-)